MILPFALIRRYDLLLEFSSHSRQANQTKAKQ